MEKESLPRLRRAIPKGCSSRRGLRYAQKKGLYKNHIAENTEGKFLCDLCSFSSILLFCNTYG